MNEKEAEAMADQHVNALMEHFEAVHILATYRDDGGEVTVGISRGGGNFYTRKGMVQEFIDRDRAENLAKRMRDE